MHAQINKPAVIYAHLHLATPRVKALWGSAQKIGHLSHMMSRGRGYIIDESKQHVSASTYHTVRHMGGNSRRCAERGKERETEREKDREREGAGNSSMRGHFESNASREAKKIIK